MVAKIKASAKKRKRKPRSAARGKKATKSRLKAKRRRKVSENGKDNANELQINYSVKHIVHHSVEHVMTGVGGVRFNDQITDMVNKRLLLALPPPADDAGKDKSETDHDGHGGPAPSSGDKK
jgi:hypothetical protein